MMEIKMGYRAGRREVKALREMSDLINMLGSVCGGEKRGNRSTQDIAIRPDAAEDFPVQFIYLKLTLDFFFPMHLDDKKVTLRKV